MSNFELYGELLTASVDDRTLSYRLLPFGEEGSTSIGKVTASKGVITLPSDLKTLVVNEEHDFKKPIGRIVSIEETDLGLNATVSIARTSAGNDALELAASGLRSGISVEIANPVVRNGLLLGGNLTGAGLVVRSAFPSAQLVASDCGDLTPTKENNMENISNENLEAASAETAPVVSQGAPVLHAGYSNKVDLGAISFQAIKSGGARALEAALADQLTTSDAGKAYLRDQEIGEVWEARKVERPLINAVTNKALTSLTLVGYKKNRTFAVADWAGNKVELPTGTFTTSQVTAQAAAKAVAVDVAMELVEFGNGDVISDLYEQAIESYAVQTEADFVAKVLDEATLVGGPVVPDQSLIGSFNNASNTLRGIGARADFVIVASNVWSALQSKTEASLPWWITAATANGGNGVNLSSGTGTLGGITFAVDDNLPSNAVLIGDKRAVTYYESKDFRYKALDVAHGGIDVSFIKFNATIVTDPGAILLFSNVVVVDDASL